ncbi:MAG: dimethyladenosine transferase [Armatimonadetes bacterium]|jgi:16S rRNA (adenine1518-N6/adenine1519-N6)-dimethyltransferase|nr:dimethyladenosine transferase [Armatimonadota bacterium]
MRSPQNLTSPATVADLLKRRSLQPKSRWGQNFLVDANLLNKVVEGGELQPDEAVLEIGPGLGALTRALAAQVRQVLAMEIDPGLYEALIKETIRGVPNIRVLLQDFLQADLEQLVPEHLGPGRHPVIANIPYSITSLVVVRLLEHRHLFDRIVLMVQKEVADRLVAAPDTSDYGSLTLFVHLHANARRVAKVPRTAFLPAPDVDSSIVRLDILTEPRFPDLNSEDYLAVVHAAFRQRRKNLANALTGPPLSWDRDQARAVLAATGIDPMRRGETLTPDEFANLTRQALLLGAVKAAPPAPTSRRGAKRAAERAAAETNPVEAEAE